MDAQTAPGSGGVGAKDARTASGSGGVGAKTVRAALGGKNADDCERASGAAVAQSPTDPQTSSPVQATPGGGWEMQVSPMPFGTFSQSGSTEVARADN